VNAHHARVPAELQSVDRRADVAARADRFGIRDVVINLDGDAIIPEHHPPELIEIGLENVPR